MKNHKITEYAPREQVNLEQLASVKSLPTDLLRSLGVSDTQDGILIPYLRQDETPCARQRLRTAISAKDGSRWLSGEGSPEPYGLWKLHEARKADQLIIVEGETDTWTLWHHGFPALGIPGASMWRTLRAEHLEGIYKVYIARESDEAGQRFVEAITKHIKTLIWDGDLFRFGMPEGMKDINDLHRQSPVKFTAQLQRLLRHSQKLDSRLPIRENLENPAFKLTPLGVFLNEPPEETSWIIEDLLPTGGVSILAAKPKVGKSTLARNLALDTTRGHDFLGRPAIKAGPVIYLALEEKSAEVQKHFKKMGATNEPIFIHVGPAPLEDVVNALAKIINEYEPILTIVDPLLRAIRVKDLNDYAQVNNALEPIMALARVADCHIMLVHHLGKRDRTGGDDVLGSTALFGAVDTLALMKKKNGMRTIETIQRYGKDLDELVIELDEASGQITVAGDYQQIKLDDIGRSVLDVIGSDELDEGKIKDQVGGNQTLTAKAIRNLVEQGKLSRSGEGKRGNPYLYRRGGVSHA